MNNYFERWAIDETGKYHHVCITLTHVYIDGVAVLELA